MAEKNELRMSVPETYSEEMWEMQGRVKALEGYLRWVRSESITRDGTVTVSAIASIMGINLTEKGEE